MIKNKIKFFLYGDASVQTDTKALQIIIIGVVFIFYGIFAMYFAILRGHPSWILWICYTSLLFMGIGALRKNSFIVAGFLYTLIFGIIFWNIDFWYRFIFQKSLWGVTDYFFGPMMLPARFISFEHFFLVPVGFYLLYLIKLNRKDAWKLSFVIILLTMAITYFFTDPAENVNCVFTGCTPLLPIKNYLFYWLIVLGVWAFIASFTTNRFSIFFNK